MKGISWDGWWKVVLDFDLRCLQLGHSSALRTCSRIQRLQGPRSPALSSGTFWTRLYLPEVGVCGKWRLSVLRGCIAPSSISTVHCLMQVGWELPRVHTFRLICTHRRLGLGGADELPGGPGLLRCFHLQLSPTTSTHTHLPWDFLGSNTSTSLYQKECCWSTCCCWLCSFPSGSLRFVKPVWFTQCGNWVWLSFSWSQLLTFISIANRQWLGSEAPPGCLWALDRAPLCPRSGNFLTITDSTG